jgi:hypothetical protein
MRRNAARLLSRMLRACGRLPDLARDIPSNSELGRKVFDRRVNDLFPAGSSEQSLIDTLENQGFKRFSGHGETEGAVFSQGNFIFKTIWIVSWKASDGKLDRIWGVYGYRAP